MTAHKREIKGVVVTKAGGKTAGVLVERKIMHKKYRKIVKKFKKYLIHDEKGELNIGDEVVAIECRPISKMKSFRLKNIVKRGEKI